MTWLTSLPAAVLVACGLVLALLVALGSRLAVRALVPAAERDVAYTIAAPLMAALGALFALFMGLTLASEASFLASAQGIVSNEAADASRLAWAATSPEVDTAPIQSALLDYLRVTRSREWSGSAAANGEDPATVDALANLENSVGDLVTASIHDQPPDLPDLAVGRTDGQTAVYAYLTGWDGVDGDLL